jgi:hypothetical protein
VTMRLSGLPHQGQRRDVVAERDEAVAQVPGVVDVADPHSHLEKRITVCNVLRNLYTGTSGRSKMHVNCWDCRVICNYKPELFKHWHSAGFQSAL